MRGGQPRYLGVAIATALTLRAVVRLARHQAEGLIGSTIALLGTALLGLDLAVPDHSPLSRRAETLHVPRPRPHHGGALMHLLVDRTDTDAVQGRRVAAGDARDQDAPGLAQLAHRHGTPTPATSARQARSPRSRPTVPMTGTASTTRSPLATPTLPWSCRHGPMPCRAPRPRPRPRSATATCERSGNRTAWAGRPRLAAPGAPWSGPTPAGSSR